MEKRCPSRADVERLLIRLVSQIAKVPEECVVGTATVDNELKMESVAFVELQVAIEETYGIELDPIRVVELNEFGAIVDYVHEIAVSPYS